MGVHATLCTCYTEVNNLVCQSPVPLSLCCPPETNIMGCVDFISVKNFKFLKERKRTNKNLWSVQFIVPQLEIPGGESFKGQLRKG